MINNLPGKTYGIKMAALLLILGICTGERALKRNSFKCIWEKPGDPHTTKSNNPSKNSQENPLHLRPFLSIQLKKRL
jgi:hypothetical protein